MNDIKVIDELFKNNENDRILKEIKLLKFKKGEVDRKNTLPTGKICLIKNICSFIILSVALIISILLIIKCESSAEQELQPVTDFLILFIKK